MRPGWAHTPKTALCAAIVMMAAACGLVFAPTVLADDGADYVWIKPEGGLNANGKALLDILRNSQAHGLPSTRYAPFRRYPDKVGLFVRKHVPLDNALSDGLWRFIQDVSGAKPPPQGMGPKFSLREDRPDARALYTEALKAQDLRQWLADNVFPPHPQYKALQAHLARLRPLAELPWPTLPDNGLKPGQSDLAVVALRKRLALLGDLEFVRADENQIFDPAVTAAVQRFQARHGLEADGVVGKITRETLNLSPRDRIATIVLNLERLRWLPRDLGPRHILVNIPGYELQAIDNGTMVMKMPVVVGRNSYPRRTPVLVDRIRTVTFRPTWTVPPFIARDDLLPKIKSDPTYLKQKNIRLFDGWGAQAKEMDTTSADWDTIGRSIGQYRLRQDPGADNALGLVRFSLDNPHDIYLHDTPNDDLFDRSQRALSSGCVRVSDPEGLAAFVVGTMDGWTIDRVRQKMTTGETQYLRLSEPLPVYVTYATAWADESGILHFSKDIYGRDADLAQALSGVGQQASLAEPAIGN